MGMGSGKEDEYVKKVRSLCGRGERWEVVLRRRGTKWFEFVCPYEERHNPALYRKEPIFEQIRISHFFSPAVLIGYRLYTGITQYVHIELSLYFCSDIIMSSRAY